MTARLEVDLFEPHGHPGAGPNYDPGQPDYLRMNFAADLIDLWWPGGHAAPQALQRSFSSWCRNGADDAYPPRAQVGAYLVDGFETMLGHAPAATVVRLHQAAVDAVQADGAGWRVHASNAVAGTYDEVLLAVGHELRSPGSLARTWAHPAVLVPQVFPVDRWLARAAVPPAARVGVRGFGLTFIDACLALTEGRGGSFRRGDHPYRLSYVPGPDAVRLLVPFARTGRPMLAKPPAAIVLAVPELEVEAARARAAITGLARGVSLTDDLLPVLADLTTASLAAFGRTSVESPDAWLCSAAAGAPRSAGLTAVEEIERSLAVGAGLAPPDLTWAIGHAWRAVYPAVVERLGDGGLREADWPAFRRLAAELERVAFGPPPRNAARLLALVAAGVVDLSAVAGGVLRQRAGTTMVASATDEHVVDVVVDAVLPGPGVLAGQNGVLDGLLAAGQARIATGRRGLDVDVDGTCRRRDGSLARGLAAIGRPTEDVVIGNDTLSRTLHPASDRWARRVVQRLLAATTEQPA